MKRFLSITTVIFLLISLTTCGKSDPEKDKRMAEIEENIAQKEAELEAIRNGSQKANEPYNKDAAMQLDEIDIDSIDFLQADLDEMISTLKANPLKAQSLFGDKYVVTKGYFQFNLRDGYTFTLAPSVSLDYEGYAICNILSQEQADVFSSIREHEELTVYGKIVAINADDTRADYQYYKIDVIKLEAEPERDFDEIEFEELTFNDLLANCKENEDTAEQRYMNAYIALTGTIGRIELDYFNIYPTTETGSIIGGAEFMRCDFTSDEQKSAIAEMDAGDTVIVYGRVTDMQPKYGQYSFHMDVMKIG